MPTPDTGAERAERAARADAAVIAARAARASLAASAAGASGSALDPVLEPGPLEPTRSAPDSTRARPRPTQPRRPGRADAEAPYGRLTLTAGIVGRMSWPS